MLLPEAFMRRVSRDLGEAEGRALCEALDTPSPVAVRLHPTKAGAACAPPHELAAGLPALSFDRPIPWSPQGWYLTERPSFTFDTDFHAGAYYVQEPSSQFVCHLLRHVETRGARILDMCAAPGGKTTLYASMVGADGLVVANEIDRRRAAVLADNVRKWGLGNVAVTVCEPRALGDCETWFDAVAVDAPCSGEGMFRKDPDARTEWSEAGVHLCARRQDEILRAAWQALRPGGTLIYSTCTFNREENEGSLERMLAWAVDEAEPSDEVPVDAAWGIVCGEVGPFRTYRFYPHRACGEGFFAAAARKAGAAAGTRPHRMPKSKARRSAVVPADRMATAEAARWLLEPERMKFVMAGDTLYAWFGPQAETVRMLSERVPVIYSGVALGQLFKGRLKPDPALAFSTELNRAALPIAELDEVQALRYLRRQEVEAAAFVEGVNLVCARGRALGFAKRIGARVNNSYPASLRIVADWRETANERCR